MKDILQETRLKAGDGKFMVEKDLFEKVLHKFKLPNKRSYDFLCKSGKKFQDSCFKMCQRMFEEEVFPDTFKDTVPHMIFKGKCRKEHLQDNRFVRCKMWLTRLAEGLLVEGGMKGPLAEMLSGSLAQARGALVCLQVGPGQVPLNKEGCGWPVSRLSKVF